MKPSELQLATGTPERALITSRAENVEAVLIALGVARRSVRCLHRDISVFELGSVAATESLHRLLLGHRSARVRLLVDDAAWIETHAPRLRALQRRFPHALELPGRRRCVPAGRRSRDSGAEADCSGSR